MLNAPTRVLETSDTGVWAYVALWLKIHTLDQNESYSEKKEARFFALRKSYKCFDNYCKGILF